MPSGRSVGISAANWRIDQIGVACRSIQRLCGNSVPGNPHYGSIETLLGSLDDISPLVPAVDAERLEGERMFSLPKNELWLELLTTLFRKPGYQPEIVYRLRFYKLTFKPLFLADHAAYLRLMHGYAKLLEQPYEQSEADTFERLRDEITQDRTLTREFSPAIGRVREFYLCRVAGTRVTRAGLALLRYREDHGALPESLGALGLDHAQDPLSHGPLLYRLEGDGFVLYSVGPDQKDNGGTPEPRSENVPYDIVWRFPGRDPAPTNSNR
jgi:hypothetical protein